MQAEAWAQGPQHVLRLFQTMPCKQATFEMTLRLDTTSASGYWAVSENGLFQFGHSKHHRPDLAQAKLMLAALDPLGMPLVRW